MTATRAATGSTVGGVTVIALCVVLASAGVHVNVWWFLGIVVAGVTAFEWAYRHLYVSVEMVDAGAVAVIGAILARLVFPSLPLWASAAVGIAAGWCGLAAAYITQRSR